MISVRPAGQVSVCGKKFNITIFSDPVNMIPKVKLCVMVELIELFPFIPLSVTLIVCQGHSSVKQFVLKNVCSYLVKLNFVLFLITSSRS